MAPKVPEDKLLRELQEGIDPGIASGKVRGSNCGACESQEGCRKCVAPSLIEKYLGPRFKETVLLRRQKEG